MAIDSPGAVIIGGGRVGEALFGMGFGKDVIVRRGDAFPADNTSGPIYVCTRNDDLKGIIDSIPENRREDLVFIQNGALMPFLEKELGADTEFTVLLVYFAVAKKGEAPIDGKTNTDPDGLTAVNKVGKWSGEVKKRLQSSGLACSDLDQVEFTQAYWEKIMWISAYMLVGALHGNCTVGEVESQHRAEVDSLLGELATAVTSANPKVLWERGRLCERLAAYSRSVAHFPTAVKEFEWRNGALYDLTLLARAAGRADPCPTHTAGLEKVGALPGQPPKSD